jgi:DNA-binding GntR family transcriptional regulator
MFLESKTKNVAVYEKLRQDIVNGKLKPGQKIVMRELAKAFGLSETPVREAIRRLQSDGYVHFTPHLGALVSKIDESELVGIYLIRIALEGLATRLATPHITAKDIDFLIAKNREMERAIERRQYEILGGLNRDFHLRIYRAVPFERLYKMIDDLWGAFERSQSVFSYVPERALASVEEHRRIIEALKTRDVELADRLMKEQKERTMEALQRYSVQSEQNLDQGEGEKRHDGK